MAIVYNIIILFYICFISVIAEEGALPNCSDLWSGTLPDSVKEVRKKCQLNLEASGEELIKKCFLKEFENDNFAKDYIGWITEVLNSKPTDQWKVNIINDYKAKCFSFIENKEFSEAFDCDKEVLGGKCIL